MNVAGKCLCETVKFVALLKDAQIHACHCNMCVRHGGSASMTLTCAEGAPEFTAGKEFATVYKSSEWGERVFCSKCGTHLFANAPAYGYFGVSAGTLEDDDKAKLEMESEIFIDKKPGYYAFTGEQKRMTEAEFLSMMTGGSEGGESGDAGDKKGD